ncbi:MAG: MarR family transcriptional regulator [Sphaerochaetaceae bacterium]|nr:MarR family transcriptional regulator [Sphaerochaetaceae bacterium]
MRAEVSVAEAESGQEEMLLLEHQICFRVYTLERAIMAAYKPVLNKLGLTYPQYLVMLVLWEKKESTVGGICEALGLDTGTVSPLLKRMERNGLIRRQRRKEDERTVMIELTEEGSNLKNQAYEVPEALAGCMFSTDGQLDMSRYGRMKDVLDEAITEITSECSDHDSPSHSR